MLRIWKSSLKIRKQCSSSRTMASWNPFSKKGVDKADMYELPEESEAMEKYQKQVDDLQREVREEYIQSRRNKSRLSASDRQRLHGEPPNVGLRFQFQNFHRSLKFRRQMFGRYGAKDTGINPGELWPTKQDIDLAKEWESLYQPAPLKQMIDEVKLEQEQIKQKKIDREKIIGVNVVKHESLLAAWNSKVDAKKRLAEGEKNRTKQILAELKEEFGYDINPEDAIMKTRIHEREKVLIKEERELKKKLRAEKLEEQRLEKENQENS